MSRGKALEYLGEAETVLLSFIADVEKTEEGDDLPGMGLALTAVLRLVSRAAGVIEATEEVR